MRITMDPSKLEDLMLEVTDGREYLSGKQVHHCRHDLFHRETHIFDILAVRYPFTVNPLGIRYEN